jgi:hypothetical protein
MSNTTPPYTENIILECNRSESVESKAGFNENFSQWTNNFNDVLHLQPGDKINIEKSFMSNLGCGQQEKSIEIKGTTLDKYKDFTHTILTYTEFPQNDENYLAFGLNKGLGVNVSEITESIMLRDDTANIIVEYYKNLNGHGYIQLPRRYQPSDFSNQLLYADSFLLKGYQPDYVNGYRTIVDSQDAGMCYQAGFNSNGFVESDAFVEPMSSLYKFNNDNSRMTIFVRDNTPLYFNDNLDPGDPEFDINITPIYARDIENADYYVYREKKEIKIPKGFNSSPFIASEITRQLKEDTELNNPNITASVGLPTVPRFNRQNGISTSASTYKPFTAVTPYWFNSITWYDYKDLDATSASFQNASASLYLQNYNFIGIKRPEIYETGRKINLESQVNASGIIFTQDNKIFGAQNYANIAEQSGDANILQSQKLIFKIEYNQENLTKFKNYIDSQAKYPEIWINYETLNNNISSFDIDTLTDLTPSNSRFFHMNVNTNASQTLDETGLSASETAQLGSSYYTFLSASWQENDSMYSGLFFTHYDDTQKDIYYENPNSDKNEYTYGCFGIHSGTLDGPGGAVSASLLTIDIGKLTNDTTFNFPTNLFNGSNIEVRRKVGFDFHFTATTTVAIVPTSGFYPSTQQSNGLDGSLNFADGNISIGGTGVINNPINLLIPETEDGTAKNGIPLENGKLQNQLYIGADNPTITFDGSHFSISDLHTSENAGNYQRTNLPNGYELTSASGEENTTMSSAFQTANTDASDIVYKINPIERFEDYTPVRYPYQEEIEIYTFPHREYERSKNILWVKLNPNLVPFAVYDSKSGIIISDFGYDEDTWDSGLWGILGFTYEQFNSTNNSRLSRINNSNKTELNLATTNCEILSADQKLWSVNQKGVPMYNDMLSTAYNVICYKNNSYINASLSGSNASYGTIVGSMDYFPSMNIKTQSVSINAQRLPRQMLSGYYTIRSNLIDSSIFFGGGRSLSYMPVMGIVDKSNGESDFYFGGESDIQFTITKPTILSSIKLSINDPDGSLASLSDGSSVVFKISRQMNFSYNILQELLQEEQQNKNKK